MRGKLTRCCIPSRHLGASLPHRDGTQACQHANQLVGVNLLGGVVGTAAQGGRVHPHAALLVGAEAAGDALDVGGAQAAAEDELDAAGLPVALVVEAVDVGGAGPAAAGGQEALEAQADEGLDAVADAPSGGDGVEGAVEHAPKGPGGVEQRPARRVVDPEAARGVWLPREGEGVLGGGRGRGLQEAKDEAVAAEGVEEPRGLEVAYRLGHGGDLLGRVYEVGGSVAGRAAGADHDAHGDGDLCRDPLELGDGGRGAADVVRPGGVELDARGALALGLEGRFA